MIKSRPVIERIKCTASIVASVPELQNLHCGKPNLRDNSSATTIESGVGWAKCVPCVTRFCTAATTLGFA
jgi:hypothetical protein